MTCFADHVWMTLDPYAAFEFARRHNMSCWTNSSKNIEPVSEGRRRDISQWASKGWQTDNVNRYDSAKRKAEQSYGSGRRVTARESPSEEEEDERPSRRSRKNYR